MRRLFLVVALSFVAVLGLAASPARAEVPDFLASNMEASAGGGCVLQDLDGLSEAERENALRGFGFELDLEPKATRAACPATFNCSSIGNCAAGTNCSLVSLGASCCTVSPGVAICCASGPIKVKTCRCRCAGIPCSSQCINSNNVSLQC